METPFKIFNEKSLDGKRLKTDDTADSIAQHILKVCLPEELRLLIKWLSGAENACPESVDSILEKYFQNISMPSWANTYQLEYGAVFYKKHEKAILFLLGTLSLPYCYAAKNGVQVLYISQRLQKDTYQRLLETGQFVKQVSQFDTNNIENWKKIILKVRLLHALMRINILKSNQWQSEWGEPINQEDMAGTNLSFSYIVLKGMRKLGFDYTPQEAEGFLHLWNVVGALLGLDESLMPSTLKEAYWLDKVIAEKEFQKSEEGVALAKALVKMYQNRIPLEWMSGFFIAQMRFLLGDKLADMLEIPNIPTQKAVSVLSYLGFAKNFFIPSMP